MGYYLTDDYPILVERWTGAQALTIVCHSCHATRVITADEIYNEDIYNCPVSCGGLATMMYAEADKCPGCGTLGWFGGLNDPLRGACSRKCMLQAEYAETLKSRAA